MNATTVTSARDIQRPPVADALAIVQTELAAAMALLRDLDVADWQRPTDCTAWNVHDVVAHMVGQNEEMARPDRLIRRVRQARRHSGVGVLDAHNQRQVRDRANVSNEQLVFELERWGNRAIRAARRIPAPLRRRMRLSMFFPEARHQPEDSFDFLVRVLMARDAWMHRSDIAAATGRPFTLDQHDGDVVRQVARDVAMAWAGPPAIFDLTGPAGGRWSIGDGMPIATVRVDAVAYLRLVSGRPADGSPTIDGDPNTAAALLATRMVF